MAADGAPQVSTPEKTRKDRTHLLYIAVILAVVLGALVGGFFPDLGVALKPLGEAFVNLIKMMISPVIFCTIVLGIGSVRQAAQLGRVGGLALGYFTPCRRSPSRSASSSATSCSPAPPCGSPATTRRRRARRAAPPVSCST